MKWKRLNPPTYPPPLGQDYFQKEDTFLSSEHSETWVARFALACVLVLFVRTLLWVMDGLFYSNPAEIRYISIAGFLGLLHGVDERISISGYAQMVRFYIEFLRESTQGNK